MVSFTWRSTRCVVVRAVVVGRPTPRPAVAAKTVSPARPMPRASLLVIGINAAVVEHVLATAIVAAHTGAHGLASLGGIGAARGR